MPGCSPGKQTESECYLHETGNCTETRISENVGIHDSIKSIRTWYLLSLLALLRLHFIIVYSNNYFALHFILAISLCRMTQNVVWELAKKKKVDIHHVDKDVLERLSEKRPHQVSLRPIKVLLTCSYQSWGLHSVHLIPTASWLLCRVLWLMLLLSALRVWMLQSVKCEGRGTFQNLRGINFLFYFLHRPNSKREESPLWLALDEIHVRVPMIKACWNHMAY